MTTKSKTLNFSHDVTFLPSNPSSRLTPRQRMRYTQPVSRQTNGVDLYLTGKASEEALEPVVRRKGVAAHSNGLLMALGGIVFVAYIFNVMGTQTFLDTNLLHLHQTVRTHDELVSRGFLGVLPYLAMAFAVAIVLPILLSLRNAIRESLRSRRLASRRPVTMQEFIELGKTEYISPKVSREAYLLLKPHYNNRMRAQMSDDLERDLDLGTSARADIFGTMLYQTDRRTSAGEEQPRIQTVLDLLRCVEAASPRSIG